MKNTIDEFIIKMKETYPYTEDEIRKSVDRISFWVTAINEKEQFIVHRYLNFLSEKFNFNIDTNVDSRL